MTAIAGVLIVVCASLSANCSAAGCISAQCDGTPAIAVMQNVDAAIHEQPDVIRENLAKQLYCPVQWVLSVQRVSGQGVTRIVEAGPGKVLAGLYKRIDKSIASASIFDSASLAVALGN